MSHNLLAANYLGTFIDSVWIRDPGIPIFVILGVAYLIRSFGGVLVSRLIKQAIKNRPFPTESDRKKRLKTLNSIAGTSLNIVTVVIASLMVINELGVNISPLIASAGFISLTLGFGAQALIRDFMAGLFITAENQYRVGDIVEIQTNISRICGTVSLVTTRLTVLRDKKGYLHHIPNGVIVTSTNKTMGYSYIDEEITIDRTADIKQVVHIVNHIGEEIAALPEFAHVLKQPLAFAGISAIDEDGMIIKIRGKMSPSDPEDIRNELLTRLNQAFIKHDIALKPRID